MADFSSSLPVRTELAGDVIVKIADATTPSQQLSIAADGSIKITDNGGSLTVDAVDLDIRNLSHTQDSTKIGDGTDFLAVNADGSINVLATITNDLSGAEVCDYQTTSALAANASINFDYTVTAATTLTVASVHTTGSGKIKAEFKRETGVGTGTYATKFVCFNSAANPDCHLDIDRHVTQVAGAKIRVTITNRDNQPQDVYSTLTGSES